MSERTLQFIADSAARLATNENRDIAAVADLIRQIADVGGVMGPPGPAGEPGPMGPLGPKGEPGRGLDDLSVAGLYRAKLQRIFEQLVEVQAEGREKGLSKTAIRALTKAQRYLRKAVGAIATDDETKAGQLLREDREARRLQKKSKRNGNDDDEDDEDDEDEDESGEDLGDEVDSGDENAYE